MAGGLALGMQNRTSWLESLVNSLSTHSFKCHPSQARLKICLVWSTVRFKVETDTDGNVLGSATDGTPTWIGTLTDEMGWGCPPLSQGGKWALALVEGQVCRGRIQKTVCKACARACWMEHGQRQQRLMLRSAHDFLRPLWWTGDHSTSLLCFVAVRWTFIRHVRSLAFAISAVLVIMESIREANLNHVGYRYFWIYHVPCHDILSWSLSLDL